MSTASLSRDARETARDFDLKEAARRDRKNAMKPNDQEELLFHEKTMGTDFFQKEKISQFQF